MATKKETRKVAEYKVPKGSAVDERLLTAADQNKLVGTHVTRKDLLWSRANNFKIDVTEIHADIIEYLDSTDDDFVINEVEVEIEIEDEKPTTAAKPK